MKKQLQPPSLGSSIIELPEFPISARPLDQTLSVSLQEAPSLPARAETASVESEHGESMVFQPSFLEPFVNEGIPRGSNISLLGPPGIGKTVLCENLATDMLRKGGNCLYVTLDRAPDEIKSDFKRLSPDLSEKEIKKKLIFVDGFSWLVGKTQEDYRIENLTNLTELSIRIASASCNLTTPILMILDSVSPLPVYNPENVVVKFLQLLLARVKSWKGLGIYVVQEGVHTNEFCNTLGYLVDGIFDMKMMEEADKITRYFRIRSLKFASHQTKWIPFVIEPDRRFRLNPIQGGN